MFHENKFATDFKEKRSFLILILQQCSLISNSSKLPSHIKCLTDNRLSLVSFSHDKIAKVIQKLDPNKALGHDNISVRMVKICGPSIYKLLETIFNQCLETGVFPSEWKKGIIAHIHKKVDKQVAQNYSPVSLLPVCGKILERLMFDEMFEIFIENKLISSSQSGFKPGDSCINQLLYDKIYSYKRDTTHEIYSSFGESLEVRSIFLDIAEAFDKVWHDGIIFKLTQSNISGNLLKLLRDFLNERKQQAIYNSQLSTWKKVTAGVPQGSKLGPLLFLIYINDLAEDLSTNAKLFADDTSLSVQRFRKNK